MPEAPESTWSRVRDELRRETTDMAFHFWLDPLELAGAVGSKLFVRAPDRTRGWLHERYLGALTRAAASALGPSATVELVDLNWSAAEAEDGRDDDPGPGAERELNPKYTFDQFVIADANRLAHAAALKAAELPGQAYSPLFIHGPPGLGKTHLLHAIGNYVRRYAPDLRVRYATVEEFTGAFVAAVRGGRSEALAAFKERFRSADVLLIDDIQFLATKDRTKEEFFHTFNALHEGGRQLVLTSDRPPGELEELEARLRERFGGGLVVEVEPPDFEARMAILRKRACHDGLVDVGVEAIEEIARSGAESVRALEGALIRVVAFASLRREAVTPALVRRVLGRLGRQQPSRSSIELIQTTVARELGVTPEALTGRDRAPRVTFARQMAMHLARELTDEGLPAIGRSFGGRNHTTVLHAHRRIAERASTDPETRNTLAALRSRIGGGRGG